MYGAVIAKAAEEMRKPEVRFQHSCSNFPLLAADCLGEASCRTTAPLLIVPVGWRLHRDFADPWRQKIQCQQVMEISMH